LQGQYPFKVARYSPQHCIIFHWLKPCFSDIPGKNDPHIGVLAAFPGSEWDKLGGKKQLDLKGLTSH
jgi:hypothetical protein